MRTTLTGILLLAIFFGIAPVTAVLPGGGISVVFQCTDSVSSSACNANGAAVYINGVEKGTISSGSFEIPHEESFSTYKITLDGYYDKTGSIPEPMMGQTSDITIDATLTQKPVGSGKGWITVHANIDGASVAFDGVTKGTIAGGVFTQEVATTGSPYSSFTVSKSGYVTYEGSISGMPADGATKDLYATLNPVPTTATTVQTTVPTAVPSPIGGDAGWYTVTCNVNDATVYFDSVRVGTIADKKLSVPVYSTGTPYKTYRVEKAGYGTATGSLPAAPAKGQTVTVPVRLDPVTTLSPTIQPTEPVNPPGSEHGWIAVHANVDGAIVTVGSKTMGTIRNGVLTIPVATTGTPFSEFTVSKPGYVVTTGTVPRQPASGETVDIYVTLGVSTVPTESPTNQSPVALPVIAAGLLGAVILLVSRKN
jgi:hypothetical protein